LQHDAQASSGRPFVQGCPSLEHVFASRVPLKAHIPIGAQHLWSQCLITALAAVARHNDERAWVELLSLPKMVLCAERRGGKGHRRRAETETKRRCRNWLEGHRGDLWTVGSRRTNARPDLPNHANDIVSKHRRCHEYLSEGFYQKGCNAFPKYQ
jgi:hypothetical protein